MSSIEGAMRKSSQDFLRLVWPVIGMPFGRPIPVETVSANAFARELDARAGIDNWLIGVDGHMRGLASRVQWPRGEPYNTFSIRIKSRSGGSTEYDKRKREIAALGALTPHYVVQAYVRCTNPQPKPGHTECATGDHVQLMSAAIALMRDVIAAVYRIGRLMPANPDGTQGWAVPWDELLAESVPIQVWPAPQPPDWREVA